MNAGIILMIVILYLFLGFLSTTLLDNVSIYISIGMIFLWPIALLIFLIKSFYKTIIYIFTEKD